MSEHEDVVSKGDQITSTYFSLTEYAAAAERRAPLGPGIDGGDLNQADGWAGGSLDDCLSMARSGWLEELPAALEIAEDAVSMCEREHEIEVFQPAWDVSGAEVDIARYLSGEPENMIDYPMAATSRVGKVITLCASVCYSSALEAETVIRRGQIITALAIALGKLGHSVELWADISTEKGLSGSNSGWERVSIRVLVKGANDTIDPASILFAYAHPGMLRRLGFAVKHGYSELKRGANGGTAISVSGMPSAPIEDLPEGTIYMPELLSEADVPDAHTVLKGYLGELGLLKEGS